MGGNILDLVLTGDPERILEDDYRPPLGNVKIYSHQAWKLTMIV